MRYCSFCGRDENHVKLMVSGTFGNICDECISQASDIVKNNKSDINSQIMGEFVKPTEIKEFLDQYIIGQDKAKERVAVAVYNHYKRINSTNIDDEVEIEKSNIILLGETGTGKCISKDTKVKIRNKITKEIEEISIEDFIKKLNLT